MAIIAALPQWLRGMIDFVFPPLCLGCGEYTEDEHAICDNCRRAIDFFTDPFCVNCLGAIPAAGRCATCGEQSLPLFACANYASPVEDIVVQYKFRGITTPSVYFSNRLYEKFENDVRSLGCPVLMPVPLHPSRENRRGYNQAELFARRLAELFGFTVDTTTLVRTRRGRLQSRLNYVQRARNIRGVFEVTSLPLEGYEVILVDDVVTSGATVREAQKTLRRGGCRVMAVISLAHAP